MTFPEALAKVSAVEFSADMPRVVSRKIDLAGATESVTSAISSPEKGEDKFKPYELLLAAFLLFKFQGVVELAKIVPSILAAADTNSGSQVTSAINQSSETLSKIITTDEDKGQVKSITEESLVAGAALLSISVSDSRKVVDYLAKNTVQTVFFANAYYERIVKPKLLTSVQEEMNALRNESMRKAIEKDLQGGLLDSALYWRLVANQATGRAHHEGILRASLERGIYMYKLVAVLDKRTSAICRHLNGRTFRVDQGLDFLDIVANTSPDLISTVAPWVTLPEVSDLTNDQLAAMGVMIPPFHPSCRTTLRPVYS